MTGTSHAVTGAAIAVLVKEPLAALPLALLSHFICDIVPHIGVNSSKKAAYRLYALDLIGLGLFFGYLLFSEVSWVIIAAAFLAGAPDFVWFYRIIFLQQIKKIRPPAMNALTKFHHRIQWSETLRYGIPIESLYVVTLLWFIGSNI